MTIWLLQVDRSDTMTIQELNDLLNRGAAEPGIREVEEMMRLCRLFDDQARDLAAIYAAGWLSTVASSTEAKSVRPASHPHADVG
jgi:hypothetical protein